MKNIHGRSISMEELSDELSELKEGDEITILKTGGITETDALLLIELAMRNRNDGTKVYLINDKRSGIIVLKCVREITVVIPIFVN